MSEAPEILLAHQLKLLKLPTFLREYEKLARQCAAEGLDHIARDAYRITCDGVLLETMDTSQACREAHMGAVLLHQGETQP